MVSNFEKLKKMTTHRFGIVIGIGIGIVIVTVIGIDDRAPSNRLGHFPALSLSGCATDAVVGRCLKIVEE